MLLFWIFTTNKMQIDSSRILTRVTDSTYYGYSSYAKRDFFKEAHSLLLPEQTHSSFEILLYILGFHPCIEAGIMFILILKKYI